MRDEAERKKSLGCSCGEKSWLQLKAPIRDEFNELNAMSNLPLGTDLFLARTKGLEWLACASGLSGTVS